MLKNTSLAPFFLEPFADEINSLQGTFSIMTTAIMGHYEHIMLTIRLV